MRNTLHLGDCLEYMRGLADASVDCLISDPPYHTTNLHYDRAPMIDWQAWWREANRVVKPTGTIVLFADDLFTIDLILTNRKQYRYRLVWEKTRRTRFLDANRRPLKAHEDILVFQRKPGGAVYNPQKEYCPQIQKRGARVRAANATAHYAAAGGNSYEDTGHRHPGTVLRFGSGNHNDLIHPNQKPEDLIRWLVRTYTNPGQLVLDTFAGSATTAIACIQEGRDYLCCERDEAYFTKAQARIAAAQDAHLQPA